MDELMQNDFSFISITATERANNSTRVHQSGPNHQSSTPASFSSNSVLSEEVMQSNLIRTGLFETPSFLSEHSVFVDTVGTENSASGSSVLSVEANVSAPNFCCSISDLRAQSEHDQLQSSSSPNSSTEKNWADPILPSSGLSSMTTEDRSVGFQQIASIPIPWWPLLLTPLSSTATVGIQQALICLRLWRSLFPSSAYASSGVADSAVDITGDTIKPCGAGLKSEAGINFTPSSFVPPCSAADSFNQAEIHPVQTSPLNLATKIRPMDFDWPVTNCTATPSGQSSNDRWTEKFSPNAKSTTAGAVDHLPQEVSIGRQINIHVPIKSPDAQRSVYKCSHCGRGFSKAYNRTIHERTHTDERPFGCNVCSRRFRRKDHLRDHSYTHLTSKPFICATCNRGFCQSRSLENHRRTNHASEKFQSKAHDQAVTKHLHPYCAAILTESFISSDNNNITTTIQL
ncbi:unnamed protein product [Calicophoron daubneyi]|uniref:C2H2-type domain-containing protein n=1 Tax=Calicophoron daubneyi TaxID=300641 RepID=A0AAV2TJ36_CALDB